MFEQARNYLQSELGHFDVIGGFLSPVHDAYGKKSLIPQHQRYEMCRAAVETSDWLTVQEWEMKQSGWTTTAQTLSTYQDALNRAKLCETPIRVKFLCGADLLESTLIPNLWAPEDVSSHIRQANISTRNKRVGTGQHILFRPHSYHSFLFSLSLLFFIPFSWS